MNVNITIVSQVPLPNVGRGTWLGDSKLVQGWWAVWAPWSGRVFADCYLWPLSRFGRNTTSPKYETGSDRKKWDYLQIEQENDIELKEGQKEDKVEEGGMDEEEVIAASVCGKEVRRAAPKERLCKHNGGAGYTEPLHWDCNQLQCPLSIITPPRYNQVQPVIITKQL